MANQNINFLSVLDDIPIFPGKYKQKIEDVVRVMNEEQLKILKSILKKFSKEYLSIKSAQKENQKILLKNYFLKLEAFRDVIVSKFLSEFKVNYEILEKEDAENLLKNL